MALSLAELDVPLDADPAGDRDRGGLRRCRGRPRLTDTDRAQRRLESRKKYDVRRVYLGESHKLWSELRRRTSLSDAGLAEYLILLNATYGDQYQREYRGKKISPEVSMKEKKSRTEGVSSLQNLVCWYQEHSRSCPQEPQLRALQPQPNSSTAAVWRCDSNHSFVQYLFSPTREASDSEHDDGVNGESDDELSKRTDAPVAEDVGDSSSRKRRTTTRKEAHRHFRDAEENVDTFEVERADVEAPLTGQSVWEMEMVIERQQSSPGAAYHSIASEEERDEREEEEEEDEEVEDLRRGRDGEEEIRAAPHGYECVSVRASLAVELEKPEEDLSGSAGLGARPEPSVPPGDGQSELFDSHALQTVVSSCEIPDQRTTLEGSQLIIITGTSYEALASEGIQLNMGGGNVEEVTCTVIGGVTYDPASESKVRAAEDEDSVTGLSDKQQRPPLDDALELSGDRELHRGLSGVRSKRNRRGPVIEEDGMLKMFHCPYEGCSQVYVAISSFQNHVNLVHRKGRTKVCPHPGCGKKFYLSNHLHRHMIIHSGVRDFICETCGKSFKRKNHLEVHRRTHTGETPLQCEICGYQCRQRASLNWHMKKHTSEAHYNFTCEFCEKRFEKLDSVKFHKLKSHPDKQAT
uniref:Zinc finger protein 653 n=1 Tax=Gasterosteus aculeatus aculeatus TaxID=481459 RepID=A0AAQ4QAF5_GASAC|nr:zinc finger protein 653 [Gasterosteus aculeatus aculeatus]